MPPIIKEVLTDQDLRTFIRFPEQLFRGNAYRVPPLFVDEWNTLHRAKNPAFDHCQARYWLAYADGKVVGRIAGIINQVHIDHWQQRYVRFGWLDFIDDPAVPAELLAAVENWARQAGMDAVHGPLGFTDMDREGMLVEGFSEIGTMATLYNPAYYPEMLERLGYAKDTDWVEYEICVPPQPNDRIAKAAAIILKRCNLHLLEARDRKEVLTYAEQLFELLCEEYRHLYGFVALSRRQVDAYIKQYFDYITPDFVPIVLDENNQMVAFGIALPSLSRALQKARGSLFPFGFIYLLSALRKNDRADLYLVAVKAEYQGKGVNAILMDKMAHVFNRLGVTKVESNPELETNQRVQAQWKYFEKRQHKRRRCFIKKLDTVSENS
jgi:hypothetical protein